MARARGGRRRAIAACAACAVLALSADVGVVVDDDRWANAASAAAVAGASWTTTSGRAAGWWRARASWTTVARAAVDDEGLFDEGLFDEGLFDDALFDDDDDGDGDGDGDDAKEDGEETVRRMVDDGRDDAVVVDDDDDVDATTTVSRDDADADGARASGRDAAVERSTLDDLVRLGGAESRALMRDLFDEANKLGIDVDDDEEDDDDDVDDDEEDVEVSGVGTSGGGADDDESSTELRALEYNAEEDDSEDERAIEQRKRLLLGLGVDIDAEPVPAIVEEETATEEERATEFEESSPREESRDAPASASVPEPEQPETATGDQNDSVHLKRRTRTLLATFTLSNVRWLTWEDMPGSVQSKVSVSAPTNADVRVVRVGGYWRAASMNNRQRRKSRSRNGFPLRKYESDEPATECNQRHAVTSIACFGEASRHAVVTVEGAHSFFPGDLVTFENINSQNAENSRALNSQYRVFALPVDLDTDLNDISSVSWWDTVWERSPLLDPRNSVFAVSFDAPGIACDAVPMSRAIVRRSTNTRLPFC